MATRLPTATGRPPTTVIRPSRGWVGFGLTELWRYRELLFTLTWRTVLVRYKQTLLGASWAILQPLSLMVVFSIIFGRVAKIPSDGIPYPIFAFAALVPWTFFANAVSQSANSLVGSVSLITKVYFPRLSIPLSAVLASAVDFLLAFGVLLAMMGYYGIYPRPEAVVVLPALLLLGALTALGAGLWLSALNVAYRDVRYVVPFLTQFWLFVTPVVYPSSLLDEPWRTLSGLNPMAGVVEGFRWSLVRTETAPGALVLASAATAVLLVVSGAAYFRRMERTFADVV